MSDASGLAISLFSELLTADQLLRARLTKVLPNRMEISHFSVLNHLARGERRLRRNWRAPFTSPVAR